MEKVNQFYGIGKGVSRLSPKFRNILLKNITKEKLYLQVERKPSLCRFQQSNKFICTFGFIDFFVTLQFAMSWLCW